MLKIKLIRKQIKENDTQEDLNKRIECLSAFLKMKCFSKKEKIPENIIEKYVEKIIFYKDDFEWYLRPTIGNVDFLSIDAKNMKKGTHELEKTMCYVPSSTGSDCRRRKIDKRMSQGKPDYPLLGQTFYSVRLEKSTLK